MEFIYPSLEGAFFKKKSLKHIWTQTQLFWNQKVLLVLFICLTIHIILDVSFVWTALCIAFWAIFLLQQILDNEVHLRHHILWYTVCVMVLRLCSKWSCQPFKNYYTLGLIYYTYCKLLSWLQNNFASLHVFNLSGYFLTLVV